MESPVWRPQLHPILSRVPLHDSNSLTFDRSNPNRPAVRRISDCGIARHTLPSVRGKYAPSRVRHRQQIPPGRVKPHRYQATDEKMSAPRHDTAQTLSRSLCGAIEYWPRWVERCRLFLSMVISAWIQGRARNQPSLQQYWHSRGELFLTCRSIWRDLQFRHRNGRRKNSLVAPQNCYPCCLSPVSRRDIFRRAFRQNSSTLEAAFSEEHSLGAALG